MQKPEAPRSEVKRKETVGRRRLCGEREWRAHEQQAYALLTGGARATTTCHPCRYHDSRYSRDAPARRAAEEQEGRLGTRRATEQRATAWRRAAFDVLDADPPANTGAAASMEKYGRFNAQQWFLV